MTDDHPLLIIEVNRDSTQTGRSRRRSGRFVWKRADKIRNGDILVCAEGYYNQDHSIGHNLARLIGAFLGDGWVRHDTSNGRYTVGLAIGGAQDAHVIRYLHLLEEVLPRASWSVERAGAYGLTCASAAVWRAIQSLGLGSYSTEKRLPLQTYSLPVAEKLALLAGYVDADGSVANSHTNNHGRTTIASTNRALVEDIRELAIACGLRITQVRRELVKSNFGSATGYRCVLTADATRKLPLWHNAKAANQRSTTWCKPSGLQLSKRGYLQLPPGIFAQTVLSVVESNDEEAVYDLTVDHPSHSFVVEGVIVHNCWRETLPNGREVMVHRKGATPAGPGVLGVIPGSMADAGFVVRGRGLPESLNSAAHGAGRQMSRKQAINTIAKRDRDAYLRERGVTLLGGGLDESPQAYKRIGDIIAAQSDLVEIVGKFTPRIVRMAEEPGDW